MGVVLTKTKALKLIVIEANATATPATVTATGAIDYMVNDGIDDISFKITHPDGDFQTFTLSSGKECTDPYLFKSITYSTTTGIAPFKIRAHVEGVN